MRKTRGSSVLRWAGRVVAGIIFVFAGGPGAWAQDLTDTFHLGTECTDTTVCTLVSFGGTQIHITTSTLPTFGIRRSPDNMNRLSAPRLTLVVMVPSQEGDLSFTANFGLESGSASLFSTTPWTSGQLYDYLALTHKSGGGPAAPIDAFLGPVSTVRPGTTGFDVYLIDLGLVFFPNSGEFSFTGSAFPVGTVFYAFVTDTTGEFAGQVTDTTAPSSSIMIVPEPSSMVLFGTGLLVLGGALRRRWRKQV